MRKIVSVIIFTFAFSPISVVSAQTDVSASEAVQMFEPYLLGQLVADYSYSRLFECYLHLEVANKMLEDNSEEFDARSLSDVSSTFERAYVIKGVLEGVDFTKASELMQPILSKFQGSREPKKELLSNLNTCSALKKVSQEKALKTFKDSRE